MLILNWPAAEGSPWIQRNDWNHKRRTKYGSQKSRDVPGVSETLIAGEVIAIDGVCVGFGLLIHPQPQQKKISQAVKTQHRKKKNRNVQQQTTNDKQWAKRSKISDPGSPVQDNRRLARISLPIQGPDPREPPWQDLRSSS